MFTFILFILCMLSGNGAGKSIAVNPKTAIKDIFGGLAHPIKWENGSWVVRVKPIIMDVTRTNRVKIQPFVLTSNERECSDIKKSNSHAKSAVYNVRPYSKLRKSFHAYCDMTTDGGGWTVFQKRMDGSENFQRLWHDYKFGFGNLSREFWLGNKWIHAITEVGKYELRIDMEMFDGKKLWAKYKFFSVADEANGYKLTVSGFSGNAGDAMTYSSGAKFSTKDKDQDTTSGNCAHIYTPFWHKDCMYTTPNGHYMKTGSYTAKNFKFGIGWYKYKNTWNISMKKFSMMTRRLA